MDPSSAWANRVGSASIYVSAHFGPFDLLILAAFFCIFAAYGLNYSAMLDIAINVAGAMSHLHSKGVLHSDIKVPSITITCRVLTSL